MQTKRKRKGEENNLEVVKMKYKEKVRENKNSACCR